MDINLNDTELLTEYWNNNTRKLNESVDYEFKLAQDHAYVLGYRRAMIERLEISNQRDELLADLKFALDVAQSHNGNIPFDWALYCEMLHQSISKAEQSHD